MSISQGPLTPRRGVLALRGFGLRIAVERGHLVVSDGAGRFRRSGRFSRVSPDLRRLVVMGHSGTLSLDAIRWLRDIDCSLVHLDVDGSLLAVSAATTLLDARVRRGQALAPWTSVGLCIAKELLVGKVRGQAELLEQLPGCGRVATGLSQLAEQMQQGVAIDRLRYLESRAAVAYWEAWHSIPVRFPSRIAHTLPAHWVTVGPRGSLLTDSPRKAITPAHALLNYLYSVLEAEARLAALAVGLDPLLGVVHTDQTKRGSLALDLMEPVRPAVDAYLRDMLNRQTFLKSDFFETHEGVCRLMPPLTEALSQTAPHWARVLAPVVERVAAQCASGSQMLAAAPTRNASESGFATPYRTPLTQRNRSRPLKPRKLTAVQERAALSALAPARCGECGGQLANPKRRYCEVCLPRQAARGSARAVEFGRLRQLAGERDERSSEAVRGKHRENALRQAKALAAWKLANPATPNPQQFTRDIWPRIRAFTVRELVAATGLSQAMCKRVRAGTATPHPMHWEAFREISTRR